jgi:Cytochrome P460
MRLRIWIAGLSGLLSLTAGSRLAGAVGGPADLASYRSWQTLTAEPEQVPYYLSLLCSRVTPERIELERKSHGPHTDRWVKVYANPAALRVLRDKAATTFPPGSIIAKEKLLQPTDSHAEGVGFMIKHPQGEFAGSGGWEFLYQPAADSKLAYDGCVTCHRAGGTKDYVFGTYDRPSASR